MTSRLDRLLLLLDAGSSASVRNTAAKQLAQLAAKSVISDVTTEEDIKTSRHHVSLGDPSAWAELMAVVARILPYLHSKSFETRTAASVALSQIFSLIPLWQPTPSTEADDASPSLEIPQFPSFSVQDLIQKGTLLLASSGKEFAKPSGILSNSAEVKKARKEAMGRLGLDFLDSVGGDEMDIEKELAADVEPEADIEMENSTKTEEEMSPTSPMDIEPVKRERSPPARPMSATSVAPSTVPSSSPEDLTTLSARERNRLKRKRKPGNSAFVAAQPPPSTSSGAKYSATPAGSSNKVRLVATEEQDAPKSRLDSTPPAHSASSEKVVVDPSKGGAVSAKSAPQSKALEVSPGSWIWDGVVKLLEVDLFSPAWEVRHGAAMALRELLKAQGHSGGMQDGHSRQCNNIAHEKWCNDLAAQLLCVFVLDRFGDFVSDQVVAPVRETVSQTLASLLLHMPRRSVTHIHSILLQMIRQDFVITSKVKSSMEKEKSHIWEVRHAGLLGIKYEVAVRTDLFETDPVKNKDDGTGMAGKEVLKGVVDAAVLGSVACATFLCDDTSLIIFW